MCKRSGEGRVAGFCHVDVMNDARGPWHDVKLHHVSGTTLNLRRVLGMTLNCTTSIHDVKLIDSPWHDFKLHHVHS